MVHEVVTAEKKMFSMKKALHKTVSAILLLTFILSVASCGIKQGSTKHGKEKVSEDAPWFDSNVVEVDLGIDFEKVRPDCTTWMAGLDEKEIVLITFGQFIESEDNKYVSVSVIDRTADEMKKMDISQEFSSTDFIYDAVYEDGRLTLLVNKYNPKTYAVTYFEEEVDLKTGKIMDIRELDPNIFEAEGDAFTVGEYKVAAGYNYLGEDMKYMLQVQSPDGTWNKTDIPETDNEIYGAPVILPLNDTTALVPLATEKGTRYYELDLVNCSVQKPDAEAYEWLDQKTLNEIGSVFYGADGKIYFKSSTGVSVIDLENKKVEELFDYGWCNVNKNMFMCFQIFDCTGDSILLCGQENGNFTMDYNRAKAASKYYIVQLNKADKNPNAGKTVLSLYIGDGYYPAQIEDAILEFNDKSDDYYIVVTDKYDKSAERDLFKSEDIEDYNLAMLNAGNELSNELAMDIISGEGPDIFLNTSSIGQLNNDNYLIDLAPYFTDLSPDDYFTGVIEASKFDGKLYQMPVCFRLDGIITESRYAGASGVGLTIDEYKQFLKGPLNGDDVIMLGQAQYFVELFNAMSDKFIKDGKVDFTCPEFSELASFVKENIPEKVDISEDHIGSDINTANRDTCMNMQEYFNRMAQHNGDITILGLPSSDGRGPLAQAYTSVAISAEAPDVEECIEFLRILLSDDIQEEMALSEHFVLDRKAFHEYGLLAADYFNTAGSNQFYFELPKDYENNRLVFSEKDIDHLEKLVMSCSRVSSEDSSISIILIEEMPAYFTGQKDLDSVIAIAQDRAQKVLDERS